MTTAQGTPGVVDARVVTDGTRLLCYVVLDHGAIADKVGEEAPTRVEDWRFLFDSVYGNDLVLDGDTDVTGFSSAYTREPLSAQDMRDWVTATAERVREYLPKHPRIVEIGCGTGLLLRELAPTSERYAVVDFSASALERLRRSLRHLGLDQIEYHHAAADELPCTLRDFDAVVIAQATQYFPGENYLRRTLTGALSVLAPTGVVYADVRSLPLLETFHVSLEAHRDNGLAAGEVLSAAGQRAAAEDELVVHPTFFRSFADEAGCQATVTPRWGRGSKELTAYRYDALLRLGTVGGPRSAAPWRSWAGEGWSVRRLTEALHGGAAKNVALTGIPHPMLVDDLATHRRLADESGLPGPVPPAGEPVLPADLRSLAAAHGLRVTLDCSRGPDDGTYDAWFTDVPGLLPPRPAPEPYSGPCTSDPVLGEALQQVFSEVVSRLQAALPEARPPVTVIVADRPVPTASDAPDPAAFGSLRVTI
ncbi:methyltransferase domain-containing protein [Streptomyces sp. NPDC012616]|uniref:class I SAM-dependent methyltransferase n=1 Tax=Streptomyces sp. NPDC012616 TaxID=3364840 RepID=UPI0036E79E9D